MERSIRRGVKLACRGKAGRRCSGVRAAQSPAAPDCRRSAVDACSDAGFAGATACHDSREPAKSPATLSWSGQALTDMRVLECRDRCDLAQPSPAYARRPARHGSTPWSPDGCVRERDRPPSFHVLDRHAGHPHLPCPDSLTTPPSGSSPRPDEHTQLPGGEVSAAFHPTCRHRNTACCQRSLCERWKPPDSNATKRFAPRSA